MKANPGWGSAVAALALLTLVALVVVLAAVWSLLPLEHTTIAVDGESISLSAISGWHAALAIAAAVAAVLLALVIAVLAVVLALGLAVFGIVVAMLSVAGVLALVFSPLLLLGWLVWRLVRRTPGGQTAAA
jgi:hypothetical protein